MLQKVSYDVAKSQLYINRCRGVVVLSRDSHLSIRLAAPIFFSVTMMRLLPFPIFSTFISLMVAELIFLSSSIDDILPSMKSSSIGASLFASAAMLPPVRCVSIVMEVLPVLPLLHLPKTC